MSRLFLALLKSFFDAQFQSLQEPEPKLLPRSAIHSTEQSRAQHAFCFWLCCLFRLSFSRSGVEQSTAQHSTAQHSTAQRSTSQSRAEHSTAQHSTAQQSRAAVCFCFCFLFLSQGLESSRAEQSNAQHSIAEHRLSTEQHSTAKYSTAKHSRAEQLSASASALCFLISSFCMLLFCVSASVSCCCLKSFCDAYQNRNLNFCLALRSSVPYFSPHSRPLLLCAVNLLLSLAPKLNTAQHSTAQHSTAEQLSAFASALCFFL